MVNRHVMFYEAEAFQFLDCLGFKIAPGRIEQTRELTYELLHLINPGIAASWHGFSLHRRFRSAAQHLMKPYPKGPSTRLSHTLQNSKLHNYYPKPESLFIGSFGSFGLNPKPLPAHVGSESYFPNLETLTPTPGPPLTASAWLPVWFLVGNGVHLKGPIRVL